MRIKSGKKGAKERRGNSPSVATRATAIVIVVEKSLLAPKEMPIVPMKQMRTPRILHPLGRRSH